MRVVALCDFHRGTGNDHEIIRAGDAFEPRATGIANTRERDEAMIRRKVVLPEGHKDIPRLVEAWHAHIAWAEREGYR